MKKKVIFPEQNKEVEVVQEAQTDRLIGLDQDVNNGFQRGIWNTAQHTYPFLF